MTQSDEFTDVRNLLRDGHVQSLRPVDVDSVLRAGRRRRSIMTVDRILAVTVLAVLTGSAAVLVLRSEPQSTPVPLPAAAGTSSPSEGVTVPLHVLTSTWTNGDASMRVLLRGRLAVNGAGCLVVQGKSTETVVIWPGGYQAHLKSSGIVEVSDSTGKTVAATGHEVALGGGPSPRAALGPCASPSAVGFSVQAAPPFESTG